MCVCVCAVRIYYSRRMLFYEHLEIMDATKDRGMNLQLQSGWANRAWTQTLAATLGLLVDGLVLQQLQISDAAAGDHEGRERAETFLRLVLGTASKRAWSMAVYDLPGKTFAGFLDPNLHSAAGAVNRCQTDCEIVQKALRLQGDAACADSQVCPRI